MMVRWLFHVHVLIWGEHCVQVVDHGEDVGGELCVGLCLLCDVVQYIKRGGEVMLLDVLLILLHNLYTTMCHLGERGGVQLFHMARVVEQSGDLVMLLGE